MTHSKKDLEFIQKMHDIIDTLENAALHEEAEFILRNNPYVFSFDRNGKWIGAMTNENGWTE
jgi:argonaute-like protein implicated in RNA metabolism and viral defense